MRFPWRWTPAGSGGGRCPWATGRSHLPRPASPRHLPRRPTVPRHRPRPPLRSAGTQARTLPDRGRRGRRSGVAAPSGSAARSGGSPLVDRTQEAPGLGAKTNRKQLVSLELNISIRGRRGSERYEPGGNWSEQVQKRIKLQGKFASIPSSLRTRKYNF